MMYISSSMCGSCKGIVKEGNKFVIACNNCSFWSEGACASQFEKDVTPMGRFRGCLTFCGSSLNDDDSLCFRIWQQTPGRCGSKKMAAKIIIKIKIRPRRKSKMKKTIIKVVNRKLKIILKIHFIYGGIQELIKSSQKLNELVLYQRRYTGRKKKEKFIINFPSTIKKPYTFHFSQLYNT